MVQKRTIAYVRNVDDEEEEVNRFKLFFENIVIKFLELPYQKIGCLLRIEDMALFTAAMGS